MCLPIFVFDTSHLHNADDNDKKMYYTHMLVESETWVMGALKQWRADWKSFEFSSKDLDRLDCRTKSGRLFQIWRPAVRKPREEKTDLECGTFSKGRFEELSEKNGGSYWLERIGWNEGKNCQFVLY